MINQTILEVLNNQINKELYSAYLYTSMQAYCANQSLCGIANWLKVQAREEISHAQKIYDYIIESGNKVKLEQISKPESEWNNVVELFEKALIHEEFVTQSINTISEIAEREQDRATQIFMQWFIMEQVEEENSIRKILERLKLSSDMIYQADAELSLRKE